MSQANIETRKLELIERLLNLKSEAVISRIEELLGKSLNENTRMSVEELESRVRRSLTDADAGRLIESKDLRSEIDKWS